MATTGESSRLGNRAARPLVHQQEPEPRVARRRRSQARHRATLNVLFGQLREIVCSESSVTASKWQVLNRAVSYIQELEANLDCLLKLKASFNLEDGNPCTLEEVKDEYARMFSEDESSIADSFLQNGFFPWDPTEAFEKDVEEEEGEEEEEEEMEEEVEAEEEEEEEKKVDLLRSPLSSSPDLLEFERYLTFYKHIMDLLTENGVVSSQETSQPIVSAAISHLWQTLSEDKKASVLQAWAQQHSGTLCLGTCPQPACTEDSVKDSGVDSQGASCSLVSTPEELLFEDAFDVANFFDKSDIPSASSSSSMFPGFNPENWEEIVQLYMQIVNFSNGLCCINTPVKQEPAPPVDDDDMMLLRCLETFDDEDL